MASLCLSASTSVSPSTLARHLPSSSSSSSSPASTSASPSSYSANSFRCSLVPFSLFPRWRLSGTTGICVRGVGCGRRPQVVCMAPEEEKMTRRSPLDFPIEWDRPKPARRPDIFPQFSPMKTPLPTPMPADPPDEDEEEEEKKEEEEENPDKEEEGDKPE